MKPVSRALPHLGRSTIPLWLLMNFLKQLLRPIYSTKIRSSEEQLRDDFGDFPPAPLRCAGIIGEFEVVIIRNIGEVFSELIVLKMILQGIEAEKQFLSTDVLEFIGAEQVLAFQNGFEGLGGSAKFIKPAVTSLMLAVMGVRLTVRMIRSAQRESKVLGFFLPIRKHESNIFVRVARHAKTGMSEASTISHEHIHLLQFKDSERHARDARSPETLVTVSDVNRSFLFYLLQKREVEARLHESVLSFYRSHRSLPLTVPKFLGMLAANQQFGELVSLPLVHSRISFDRTVESYPEREAMWAEQLESILLFIQTTKLTSKFITEVLTVMYGNLLRYYGDEVESQNYLKGIERPNLYDELYGLQTS